ncbi:MAG: YCF48-related protein [Bacteroidia bacterium]|nr:YCF48-related protein [Bacteroidia bacterium]
MNIHRHGIFLIFLLLPLFCDAVNAQIGWTSMNTGTTRDLEGVFSVSQLQMIAVGASGSIVGTTNGGASWISAPSGSSQRLRKVVVAGFSTPVLWVVGDAGTLLFSTSGGYTWNAASSGTTADLHDIFAIDYANATSFCAVGASGTIIGTTNSGTNWFPMTSATPSNLNGVFFTDPLLGCIVGDAGTILLTSNGGGSWTSVSSGVTVDLNHVFFTSLQSGWICGDDGKLLTTTDGGQSWAPVSSGVTVDLRRMFFSDAQTGTVIGRSGTILRTTNGGTTWTQQVSGTGLDLNSVFFTDANNGVVVGDNGLAKKTTNGGVPVELSHFSARSIDGGAVVLEWSTVGEVQNFGFYIERWHDGVWQPLGFVAGGGDVPGRRDYQYMDRPEAGLNALRYRLRQVDYDGTSAVAAETVLHRAVSPDWKITASPNPVAGVATLHVVLANDAEIELGLYDLSGKCVETVFSGAARAGSHQWRWNRGTHRTGLYIAVLRSATHILSAPMVLL